MKSFRFFVSIILFLVLIPRLLSDEFAPLFPFVISHDAPDNITNVATWSDATESWRHAPAGKYGIIRAENGRFVHDKGRFLIWGTNLCGSACFPDKESAEQLAVRLARLGFNCVRMHHMDNTEIWGGWNAKSKLTIDPTQLDKLDYLIYQLKLRGIYTNLNLHVSRTLDDRDGFPHKDERPQFDKGLDNFYPPFVESQKKFAKDLLTHVNPYTQTAYVDEPAVSMIEINNENSIVSQWTRGRIVTLPEPYQTEFLKQWNEFLCKKYKSTKEVAQAWECFDEPLGKEMLPSGMESQKWHAETDSETQCKKIQTGETMRFEINAMGRVSWHPQLIAGKLVFEEGKPYTFSIRIKANKPTKLSIQARMSHDPWQNLGFHSLIHVGTEWTDFSICFVPTKSDDNARFDIAGFSPGVFEFANASLKPGGVFGLQSGQKLEDGTIPIIARSGSGQPTKAVDDFCEFVFDVERTYWLGMYRFLKDELKVRQPISGTQLRYGSSTIQAELDYIDNHAYWNHPDFPGKPWDQNNWTIRNRALVNHLDTDILPLLGTARIHGKPYTVSEFDSPMPNQYAAEALPILAAFGRFQGWDGCFHFAYSHNKGNFSTKKATSFFDMVGNTVKMAHQPACVAMFRRGDVAEGKELILGGFTPEKELELFKKDRGTQRFLFKGIGLDPKLCLFYRTALDLSNQTTENIPAIHIANPPPKEGDVFRSRRPDHRTKHPEFSYNADLEKDRLFIVSTDNTVLLTGFNPLGTLHVSVRPGIKFDFTGKTRLAWSTISLVSVNGNGFEPKKSDEKPIRVLVTATGLMQNTGMNIERLDGDKITFGNRWGKEPVLCEGIPIKLEFSGAKSLRCFALDGGGNRQLEVKADENRVELGPQYKTIWYEIELN